MENIKRIAEYFRQGETQKRRLGVEVEYFVCDDAGGLIAYDRLSAILNSMAENHGWKKIYEEDNIIGLICDNYTLTLEPAGQLEISIDAFEDIAAIEQILDSFMGKWKPVLRREGYELKECGVFPGVESGVMTPDELTLMPKKRYEYMDRYFKNTGRFGKYMMRATASTQVSVDYSSMEECMRKIRIIQKMAPWLSLLMENFTGMGVRAEWDPHLLRMQIWEDVDSARCGYIPGSLEEDFSYEKYATLVYQNPFILLSKEGRITDVGTQSAEEYLAGEELDFTEHLLTMFFFHVRLKKYIEIRIADSVSPKRVLGYVALVKGLLYAEESLAGLEKLFASVKNLGDVREAELAIRQYGYDACRQGRTATEYLYEMYEIAYGALSEEEQKYLKGVLTLPILEYIYRKEIEKDASAHADTFWAYKEYMLNSTAKYHGRVARTMYLPKLFTEAEADYFRGEMKILFGIFDKVIAEYERSASFRQLFGFDERLEELILRERNYSCNIPIARIDMFYNEQTGEYKFCEFNTDGSSAMNEDRELNNGLRLTKAYQDFAEKFPVKTFELFDSWIDEFLALYSEFATQKNRRTNPNVVIVDFLEHGTVNEFHIFAERFRQRGLLCEVCDIRELKYDGEKCTTPSGMEVDAIYRRAVTSDIFHHYEEVAEFLAAVKADAVCMMGDFRTQIVHNKILYKILHLSEVQQLFTEKERRYIKAHVPYTVSLTAEWREQNPELWEEVCSCKDHWIIKPEDSYGSLGVHAGVECEPEEWIDFVKEAMDKQYILQEFCTPYRLPNVEWLQDSGEISWRSTSNLTGMFMYGGKLKGLYSRTSYDQMISTQYNEMTLPTLIVSLDA